MAAAVSGSAPTAMEHTGTQAEQREASPIKSESDTGDVAAQFPSGLRVLVVDDDPLCLKVVGHMLRRCSYEVTTSINGNSALEELRQHPNHYDLVLSDVYMPDMNGFKLLEHIGLELDLPVIMMSSNGETNVVLRGVTHGAVDFLIKPVRIEELRNVWQHVVRRRRESAVSKDSEDEHDEEAAAKRNDRKRKSDERPRKSAGDSDGEGASAKKARVVWSVEMHQQFVNAVNTLGVDKAVPKRILDLMNVEGLTRENVASHLQKYRLYLKRVSGVSAGGSPGAGMPGVGRGCKAVRPAVNATPTAAAATVAPGVPTAAAAPVQPVPVPVPGALPAPMDFPQPSMGMQQTAMMGQPGAGPEQMMRLQLQTLQMQAMSLGAGGQAGMMPPGMSAPMLQQNGMPMAMGGMPGAAGFPPGMAVALAGMPLMPPMPLPSMSGPLEYGMPPPGVFTGDVAWGMATPAGFGTPDLAQMGGTAGGMATGPAATSMPMPDLSATGRPASAPLQQPNVGIDPAAASQPPPFQLQHNMAMAAVAGHYPGYVPDPAQQAAMAAHMQAFPQAYMSPPQQLPQPLQQHQQQHQPQHQQPLGQPHEQQPTGPMAVPEQQQGGQDLSAGDNSMDDILQFFLKDGETPQ